MYWDSNALLHGSTVENLASNSKKGNDQTIFIKVRGEEKVEPASERFIKMPTKMSGMEFWRLDCHIHLDVKHQSSGRWEARSTWWRPWWMPVSSPGGCWGGGESSKSHLKVRGSKCFCPGTEHIWPSHRCGMQDVSYGMQSTGVYRVHQLIAKMIAIILVKIMAIINDL